MGVEMKLIAKESLLRRIREKTAIVGVIGLGYVGLPFAVEKAKVGFSVIGLDRNQARVDMVNRGLSYIDDVCQEELRIVVSEGRLRAETDFTCISEMDAVVICVPTPLTKNRSPDLRFVTHVAGEISSRMKPGQLISLESTTYPGTTREVILPILESSGLRVEEDFFVSHSPERVDPGNTRYSTKNTNKIVGGIGPGSLEVAQCFYEQTVEHVVPVSSTDAAELVKVFENTFRAVNIALVNELAQLCYRMRLNVWEVLDAAFTKPFGILPFYPGPGVGGHCIPIDPHYLEWKAKEFHFHTHFIALAGEINRGMPGFVVERTLDLLYRLEKPFSKMTVLVLGAAYKRDLSDYRESPNLLIMKQLQSKVEVRYHDPLVPFIHDGEWSLASVSLTEEEIRKADLVLILTDHRVIDYGWVAEHASLVFDTRNAVKSSQWREKVHLL
ncbi:nucleotide sugar dehydrogenase [Paenibacillus larvae]|uniref:Nucleotide sugar dehydrogenase n=1 Tax=Paenibacillus larvae TaxID=1464 RepID=A0AAP5JXR7_9BACL|nr:nucleotide sugar dehydrogenase [Paenibacillus larvae]AQR76717.1 UDP-N-acetyl-D-glucosamine dehydrogenase [Paenibacillus larvae subsp. larvae]AVF22410.1 UDP-N-acetyl-D-mannosamine dehydrogenase WecC [Paenibacillus larvae subsp. larvae]ETK26739.1 UDP-N-acetyl-D-mannosamine dehydrogenase WecC [Paenibacillus larvae subsp. larvae DSM 25719]MCY7478100.1 nucleotide sugar dehydrogenase [Paenibacillus larvae]MCY7490884.1 nucleotide sugar dehydrogenase [Paenibacillus larvae]